MNRILDISRKLIHFSTKVRLVVLFILYPVLSTAQTFPVQVVTQAIPPAPIYVSNYADASTVNSPLRVQITLNDFEISNREIRLKTYFEGSGLTFQSNDIVVGASPLFLEGGIPLVLTNVELAPYFEFNNITGINANQYGNPIPEGAYQFCVEVYDVLTGSRLSDRSCAVSVVFQNEPPFLVLPQNKINVDEVNPQYIVFQWTPRSINVSNVEYELSLVEIWDTQVDPQQAFLSSPPVFQTTTSATTYVYGPADPLLLSGKNYAWRVQAKAKQGIEEIGLFKNQGYSEIFSFSYAGSCDLPLVINHEVKGSTNANIFWDDFSTEIPEFTVRYRQKNVQDAEWFLAKSTFNDLTIWNLKAGTTYEYQLSKNCGITQSDWSFTKEFTTALEFEEESVLDCGVSPDINLTNMEPLASIGNGATFKAGDFPVKILEVSGGNGRFTGKGYVTLPYLKNIKVAVEFTNILINTDSEMAEGSVRTAYDADWGNILDTGDVVDVLDDVGDVFTGGDNVDYEVDFEINSANDIKIEDGEIIITGPNGETKTFDHDDGDTYQIKDANGDTYNIDEDGNITKGAEAAEGGEATTQNTDGISGGSGTADAPSVSNITANGVAVTFKKSANTKYDLDIADSDFEKSKYPKAKLANGTDYYPIHKAVVDGQTDEFLAEISISNSNISIDDLIVKTVSGSKIDTRKEGNSNLIISLKGVNSYRSEEAIVTYKDENDKYKIAASFFIHHIKQQELVNVVIVSVNGTAQLANLEQELNGIFGKAGAQFKVSTDVLNLQAADWDDNSNGKLDYDGSGLLSDYPQELKNIQQKYKQDNPSWDAKAYHLFLLPNDISLTKPLSGFMPKTRQWGYIFNAHKDDALENKSSQNLVAAHELGHGAFKLPHPFQDDENKSGSGTNWLMDYNNGDQLPYAHWAAMSDESLQLFLFQDEEDSESASNPNSEVQVKVVLNHIKSIYSENTDVLKWKNLMQNRCVSPRENLSMNCSLIDNYSIDIDGGKKLKFRVVSQPSVNNENIILSKTGEKLKIKKRRVLFIGGVYDIFYQLSVSDNSGNSKFVFEFGHHDEIESFCKYLGINGKNISPNEIVEEVEDLNSQEAEEILDLPTGMTPEQYYAQNSVVLDPVVIIGVVQTNISKSIVNYLDSKYLPSNIDENTDCNDIDLYFSEIPSFHTTNNLTSSQLWSALGSLLKCSLNERYTNEEKAALTIIKSLGSQNSDAFLNGIIENKIGDETLFKILFNRLDDWGGEDNFTAFIKTLTTIWKESSYSKLEYEPLPYESEKIFGFYISDYSLLFDETYANIKALEAVGVESIPNSYYGWSYNYDELGTYSSFAPILLTNYKNIDSEFKLSGALVPMFGLKALSSKNSTSNFETGGILVFDVVTTLSGVGNLAKLRHLRHLNKLGKLKSLKIVFGATEVVSGSAGLILQYSECNTDVCKKLRIYLTVLEIASLGSDAYLSNALRKSADDALEAINKSNQNVPDEIIDELTAISKANVKSIDELVNLVDEQYRAALRVDLEASSELVQAFSRNSDLANGWKILKDGPETLRRNSANLEKLSKFISETVMEESKLISSFGNTKNPQKWIDMKIPESELDDLYSGFKNSPPVKFKAWTPEHKAQRWANYKEGNPNSDFKTWSNQYDGNIDKAIAANKGVDDYFSGLSGNLVREKSFPNISINTSDGVQSFTRRLDIVDEDAFKGIEFKEYSSGKVYRSPDIRREYVLDGELLDLDLLDEIEWVFKGCEPSTPLRADLESLGIKITLLP